MATTAVNAERDNYLNQEYGIKSWLLTIDHKRIALLYLLSVTFFFFIGGFFALLIRLELLTPAGDLVQADTSIEDELVFPLAARMLSGAEKSAISEEMASRRRVKLVPEPIVARTGAV